MRARLPMMIQDPEISQTDVGRMVEDWIGLDQEHFLDGPITPRIAVVDLDPDTEALRPRGEVPAADREPDARALRRQPERASNPGAFIAVSAFATVWRTVKLFEEAAHARPRRSAGGSSAPQLLVVPRAGWLENAYYERGSHSLQFFCVRRRRQDDLHEPLARHRRPRDGARPDRRDRSGPLRRPRAAGARAARGDRRPDRDAHRLRQQPPDARDPRQDRGADRPVERVQLHRRAVRRRDRPAVRSRASSGTCTTTRRSIRADEEIEPHALSQVISGVLYELIVEMHEHFKDEYAPRFGGDRFKASGLALAVAAPALPSDGPARPRLPAAGRGHLRRFRAGDPGRRRGLARRPPVEREAPGEVRRAADRGRRGDARRPDELRIAAGRGGQPARP